MSNGVQEIERVWVVDKLPNLKQFKIDHIHKLVHNYVLIDGAGELRCSKINVVNTGITILKMAIKSGNGMVRTEIEKKLTPEEYNSLKKVSKASVSKTVIDIGFAGISVYSGNAKGLITVEVEFPDIKTAKSFIPPKWFGKEVTNDVRYRAKTIAFNGIPQ